MFPFEAGAAMPYSAEISRDHRTAFLFVIDQSESMDERPEGGRMKSEFVADVLNKTLYTLVTNCSKADGVRNYFDIGVLGYCGDSVTNGLGGTLAGSVMHPIAAVADAPLRVEERTRSVDDGAGGIVEQKTKFPVWFDPRNDGETPMRSALTKAAEVIAEWCDTHPDCYPPTILHVTDGWATDGDPEEVADALQQLHTNDGQAMLFNLHVTSAGGREIVFPTGMESLGDEYARMLYRMSSPLPPHLAQLAADKGYSLAADARGFIFNADPKLIVDFFDIGTRPRLMAGHDVGGERR
jgi:hypothetical protein